MSELCWTSMTELRRMIASKKVSPVEVVRAHLDRIAALDGKLKSYITVLGDAALAAASAAPSGGIVLKTNWSFPLRLAWYINSSAALRRLSAAVLSHCFTYTFIVIDTAGPFARGSDCFMLPISTKPDGAGEPCVRNRTEPGGNCAGSPLSPLSPFRP